MAMPAFGVLSGMFEPSMLTPEIDCDPDADWDPASAFCAIAEPVESSITAAKIIVVFMVVPLSEQEMDAPE
jgi:hypothetical protein